jgi:hypothetical protein
MGNRKSARRDILHYVFFHAAVPADEPNFIGEPAVDH